MVLPLAIESVVPSLRTLPDNNQKSKTSTTSCNFLPSNLCLEVIMSGDSSSSVTVGSNSTSTTASTTSSSSTTTTTTTSSPKTMTNLDCTANNSDTTATTTSKTTKKTKVVTFKPSVRAQMIRPASEYTAVERERCWYSETDLIDIRKQIARQIKRHQKKVQVLRQVAAPHVDHDDDEQKTNKCIDDRAFYRHSHRNGYVTELRGLERKTKIGSSIRIQNRLDVNLVVHHEQMYQWQTGIVDPYRLAYVYQRICQPSQQDAYFMALLDEQEAKRIYNHENTATDSCVEDYEASFSTITSAGTAPTVLITETDRQYDDDFLLLNNKSNQPDLMNASELQYTSFEYPPPPIQNSQMMKNIPSNSDDSSSSSLPHYHVSITTNPAA